MSDGERGQEATFRMANPTLVSNAEGNANENQGENKNLNRMCNMYGYLICWYVHTCSYNSYIWTVWIWMATTAITPISTYV
jgi:hypothetical protein